MGINIILERERGIMYAMMRMERAGREDGEQNGKRRGGGSRIENAITHNITHLPPLVPSALVVDLLQVHDLDHRHERRVVLSPAHAEHGRDGLGRERHDILFNNMISM